MQSPDHPFCRFGFIILNRIKRYSGRQESFQLETLKKISPAVSKYLGLYYYKPLNPVSIISISCSNSIFKYINFFLCYFNRYLPYWLFLIGSAMAINCSLLINPLLYAISSTHDAFSPCLCSRVAIKFAA